MLAKMTKEQNVILWKMSRYQGNFLLVPNLEVPVEYLSLTILKFARITTLFLSTEWLKFKKRNKLFAFNKTILYVSTVQIYFEFCRFPGARMNFAEQIEKVGIR